VCAAVLICFLVTYRAWSAQQLALDEAVAAYRAGKTDDARRILTAYLEKHPNETAALILMGAVLDSAQSYGEAEPYYRRALDLAPKSPQVLNNAGNHYLAAGDRSRAHDLFLKTIALDPRQDNANLQLATMDVEDKQGQASLAHLDRVSKELASEPAVRLLRARALALARRCPESASILEKLDSRDASIQFAAGMAYADCKRYSEAETSFARALESDPKNFDILYNLGLAALRAGHRDRAQSVLEITLRERPSDADTVLTLARIYADRGDAVRAVALLSQAEKTTPDRAEIALALAQVSAGLGFYEDSAAAYDRYLKLKPADDTARRERGFAWACANRTKVAVQDLEWYVARHPHDAIGYYELAVAHVIDDRAKAISLLDKAIAIDPALNQARYTRALLNVEQNNPAAAITDLELYIKTQSNDAHALAYLGKAYLAANRATDAATVLERARSLDPHSWPVLVQYRRALVELGRTNEASALGAELKASGNSGNVPKHRVGLIDYLSLPPAEQRSRYVSNLRQENEVHPGDVRLTFALARALLTEGKEDEGVSIFQRLPVDSLDAALLRDCGRTLLDFGRFAEARPFLERAVTLDPERQDSRIDLTTAIFHSQNPDAALAELDKTPAAQRNGDYYLLRAQILDAQGNIQAVADALNQAMRAEPARANLYYEASSFLLKHKLYKEALQLLDEASRILPDDRDLLLAKAVTLDLLRRTDDCDALLSKIQARWPEWNRPYLLKGILLQTRLEPAQARRALDTAIALGANTPEAYYYQALSIMDSAPEDLGFAETAITHALALSSQDPYIYLLAGKIALARKDYVSATAQLLEATRLAPALVPAHYALRDVYNALGDQSKASDELKTIKRISADTGGTGDVPVPFEDILFTVHR